MKKNNFTLCLRFFALSLALTALGPGVRDVLGAVPPAEPAVFPAQPAPAAPVPPGGFGVSLGPSQIRFSSPSGASEEGSVRVSNQSSHPMQFLIEIADIGNDTDAEGKLNRVFLTPGTTEYSCAPWIQLSQNELTVPPGESYEFKFLLAVPPDSTGGHAAVIFFRGVPAVEKTPAADAAKPTTTSTKKARR